MFKIVDRPEFTHDVAVMVPSDGGFTEETFKARFRVLSPEKGDVFALKNLAEIKTFLTDAIVSFEDVVGPDDKPVPFSDALRDQMLALVYVRTALMRTYVDAISKARAGN